MTLVNVAQIGWQPNTASAEMSSFLIVGASKLGSSGNETTDVEVLLRDAHGNVRGDGDGIDDTAQLSVILLSGKGTITPSPVKDASGNYRWTVTSASTVGSGVFQASIGGNIIGTVTVEYLVDEALPSASDFSVDVTEAQASSTPQFILTANVFDGEDKRSHAHIDAVDGDTYDFVDFYRAGVLIATANDLGDGTHTLSVAITEAGIHAITAKVNGSDFGVPVDLTVNTAPTSAAHTELIVMNDVTSADNASIIVQIWTNDEFGNETQYAEDTAKLLNVNGLTQSVGSYQEGIHTFQLSTTTVAASDYDLGFTFDGNDLMEGKTYTVVPGSPNASQSGVYQSDVTFIAGAVMGLEGQIVDSFGNALLYEQVFGVLNTSFFSPDDVNGSLTVEATVIVNEDGKNKVTANAVNTEEEVLGVKLDFSAIATGDTITLSEVDSNTLSLSIVGQPTITHFSIDAGAGFKNIGDFNRPTTFLVADMIAAASAATPYVLDMTAFTTSGGRNGGRGAIQYVYSSTSDFEGDTIIPVGTLVQARFSTDDGVSWTESNVITKS